MGTPASKDKPAPKKRKLTIRQQKLRKEILKGKSASQAMRDAGYSPNTAKAMQKQTLAKIGIAELMEKKGLTDDRLLDVMIDGLKATKVISCNVIAKDGEGMADANSMTKDFVDTEDYAVRHKYMETGLKLKGHLKEKLDVNGEVINRVVFEVIK
jgi:DNA-binding CsgD family transcriptional regulator